MQLQDDLDQVILNNEQTDHVWWSYQSNGCFSVKSFRKKIYEDKAEGVLNVESWKKIWSGLAPPKVELLLWFVIRGRLSTKDRLVERLDN